ncbi:hypothetical protein EUX98_g5332 [Antrodiella citrinella]|uniref:Ornithine cyclodeaminase n=1 Tax=Antrodiella citrinella TaxID=2447956 RepID=A0A4S4MRT9_9APHY|nr:hypothetical protein EUX98_g5332 [Antrodiella citrinella]
MSALFLSAADVDAVTSGFTSDELVALMVTVFTRLSQSASASTPVHVDIAMPHRTVVPTSSHSVLFMPSRLAPFGTALKVVSVPTASASQDVRERGLPATTLVMDEQTGQVKAIVNAGKLTALRNAAGSLLSSRLLVPLSRPPHSIVAVGSGAQIAAHISLFLQNYHTITRCTIFNRSANTRLTSLIKSLHADSKHSGVVFEGRALPTKEDGEETAARSLYREALLSASIVITATSSALPLFPSSYISPGTHLCLIGSYTPTMHEVDTDLIQRAGVVVVDSREACKVEAGELIAAATPLTSMVEIGELVTTSGEPAQHLVDNVRRSGNVTIFKSVGVGIQDVAIASAVVDRAIVNALGTVLQL